MTQHQYPAVSHPQAQETRQDILTRLQRYMEQWEVEAGKWEARANELSASLNAERAAHEVARKRGDMFLAKIDEARLLLECEPGVTLYDCLRYTLATLERQLGETLAALSEAERQLEAFKPILCGDAAAGVGDG